MLDYGCGTGNHTISLNLKGYEISGIDKSDHMLDIAGRKLKHNKNISFFNIEKKNKIKPNSVDVCITLFDVMSYMNDNQEINQFLSYLKEVLVNNGLFIFDFWYGPGVINLVPEKRWCEYNSGELKILRLTSPECDCYNCIVNVTHEIFVFKKDRLTNRFTETHKMRYFFKNELLLFLNYHGFEIVKFGAWKDINNPPTKNDWSSLAVCKLVKQK